MSDDHYEDDPKPPFTYTNPLIDILYSEDHEPDWLIHDMIPQGTLVCLAGESGAGKSYVTYTLGLAVASGWSALSGIVPEAEPRRVVYFDEENSEPDRNTYLTRSWRGLVDSHGAAPDVGLLHENFIPAHFELGSKEGWYDRAGEFIDHFQPHLVVFDTAASAFGILNENDNAEAGQVIRQIKTLMRVPRLTATCIVLKHAKVVADKGGKRSIRGATIWKSLADQTMFQVRCAGRPRKGGLQLTRLIPDKGRAWALKEPIYITPSYMDERRTGLLLEASHTPSGEHKRRLTAEETDDDDA